MPQHSSSAFPGRVLQERSPNVQADTQPPQPQLRRPLQRIVIQSAYDGRETILTNKAGDHVLKHAHFYQLTKDERETFIWLRGEAFRVPKYEKYRKGTIDKPRGKDARWDDVREDLFFKALVKFPPMWRDKRPYKPFETPNSTYGRNEHIAFYINDILGYVSSKDKLKPHVDGETVRKQVSSHLQVLKNYFRGQPLLLRWMASEVKTDKLKRQSSITERTTRRTTRQPYPPIRRMHPAYAHAQSLPEPSAVLASQGSHAALSIPKFPEYFHMFLKQESQPVHIYTQWQKHNASPYDLDRTPKSMWCSAYPLLERILNEADDNCTLLSAETSLQLPDVDMDYCGKSLDINFSFKCDPAFLKQNSFFVLTEISTAGVDPEVQLSMSQACPVDTGSSGLGVPFAGDHWAKILHDYALKQASVGVPGGLEDPEYLKRRARLQVEAELRNVSAVQKVFRRSNDAADNNEDVVLMIYWKFRLAKSNEIGTTSFREFIRPASTTTPDLWANHDLQLRLAKREESSFAIKDELTSFDNSYGLHYGSYDLKLEDQPSYSFDIHSNPSSLGYSSYDTTEISHVYDNHDYGMNMLGDLPSPVEMSGSDTESDMGEFTQMTHDEYSMLDHAGLASMVDHQASQPLLGPGDGLALGIGLGEHLPAYDPALMHSAIPGNMHNLMPHHDTITARDQFDFHALTNAGRPDVVFSINNHTPIVDQEPTHFHHYHRRPRLAQIPHGANHPNTPELHTPIHESDLVPAAPWVPDMTVQGTEEHQAAGISHQGLLHPPMPRLFRHDSDTTISIEDMDEYNLVPASHPAAVYAQAQPVQLYHDIDDLGMHDDHAQLLNELQKATKSSTESVGHEQMLPVHNDVVVDHHESQAGNSQQSRNDGQCDLDELAPTTAEELEDADWELLPHLGAKTVNTADTPAHGNRDEGTVNAQ